MLTVSKQPFSLVRQAHKAAPVALDPEQLAVVSYRGCPIVVQGGPGTGKTTVLDSMYKQIYDDLNKVNRKNMLPKAVQ